MGTRNYGLGTRDMASAGRIALQQAADRRELSYSSVDTVADRWSAFTRYAKAQGVGRMERVDRDLVEGYGRDLAMRVEAGELSPSTAHNYVSAVNTIMGEATGGAWDPMSPRHDCDLPARSGVRDEAPADDRDTLAAATAEMREAGHARGAAVAEVARELGLRSKEASLLDARSALEDARDEGRIYVEDGTKGGLTRELAITDARQLATLQAAADVQGDDRSLIPADTSWAQWRDGELRVCRETLQAHGIDGYHELRAAYACERYETLTGCDAPVVAGEREADDEVDHAAREEIARELGHGRAQITSAYVGGR